MSNFDPVISKTNGRASERRGASNHTSKSAGVVIAGQRFQKQEKGGCSRSGGRERDGLT